MAAKNSSNEIKLTRLYDAPIEVVWDAWTDPAQAAQWWGPRGFTITTHSKDLRVGGHWNYTMHGPDGVDYPNTTTYLEVEEQAKLVYDHGASEGKPPIFRVTVLFSEVGEKTKMDMTMALPTPEAAAQTKEFIKKAGGEATWDRLAEYLEKEASGKEKFVINRSFDAPIDLVYQMWSDPQHLSRWLPPTGFRMEFIRADIRNGGSSFYKMTNDDTVTMYGRAEYLELKPPESVTYAQQFCDENENISRHPFAPTWPETMLTKVEFFAEGPDRTRVTVTWEPHGGCTAAELDAFLKERGGMTKGWTGSFDKLEQVLGAAWR